MDDFTAFLDTSDVQPGKLEDLKVEMAGLADFVKANEPRIISYSVHFSAGVSPMGGLQFHPDVASLEFPLEVAGPKFPPVAPFVKLRSIEIFGQPSQALMAQLEAKAQLLGDASVIVRELHAGFARL